MNDPELFLHWVRVQEKEIIANLEEAAKIDSLFDKSLVFFKNELKQTETELENWRAMR